MLRNVWPGWLLLLVGWVAFSTREIDGHVAQLFVGPFPWSASDYVVAFTYI